VDDDHVAGANVLVFEGQIGTEEAALVQQHDIAIGREAIGKGDGY
jgi:hypothetical protein